MIVQALTAKQRTSLTLGATHKLTIYEGSVRSSKTITSLIDWIKYVRTAPPGRLAIIGKTERTIRNNIIGPLIDMLGRRRVKFTQGTGELHMLGRTILVVGANDERASDKIRGITLAGAYVDEITIIPESFWEMLLSRLSIPGSRLIGTTNPDSPAHWLKVKFLDRARTHLTGTGATAEQFPVGWSSSYDLIQRDRDADVIDLARLSYVLDDNPTLEPDFRAYLDTLYVGLWRKRFIAGQWVAAEGAIYDMLDLDDGGRHRTTWNQLPLLTDARWLGIDYGTANPFHAVLIGSGIDQRLYVLGEWRYDGRTQQRALDDGQYESRLRAWLNDGAGITLPVDDELQPAVDVWPHRVAIDPSAASFRALLRNRGWGGLLAADNSVLDGIRNVSSLLAAGRLRFVKGAAPVLERELLGYVWDPKAQKKGEDAPLKQDDHGPDALRYGVQAARVEWRPWLGVAA